MTLPSETVTLAGSGLVFHNVYDSSVTAPYRGAIIAAENFLQSEYSNPVTVRVGFDATPFFFSSGVASNTLGSAVRGVSYDTLVAALQSHATTADDFAALASLPAVDPSGGKGFDVPIGMARALGLPGSGNGSTSIDSEVSLNSLVWTSYGSDASAAVEHELSEGIMGRFGSLGVWDSHFAPMDLFRYNASGQHDYTGGKDGQPTYFSVDGNTLLTQFQFHSSVNTAGRFDGADFADWTNTHGDAFGPGGPGSNDSLSATDLRLLDILGWTPMQPGGAVDDYANSLTDTAHKMGQVSVGSSAAGTIDTPGDRDWFSVTLAAGATYQIDLQGQYAGAGTLEDSYLRLHDATGALIAENDDIVDTVIRDSRITYTPTLGGSYYLEAGAFADDYTGTYRIGVTLISAPTDDYANNLTDKSHPFGQVTAGGSATGTIEVAGDRDWFRTTLSANTSYVIDLKGQQGGGGTLADPYLRLHDSSGALVGQNDDLVPGVARDSELVFRPGTTDIYYVEAGAAGDSASGSYTVSVAAGSFGNARLTATDQSLNAPLASATTTAYSGPVTYLQSQFHYSGSDNITVAVTSGANVWLQSGSGDDALTGGFGQNIIDGGTGSNFLTGNSGGGTATFYTDLRGGAVVWNTIADFHSGDAVTLWGFKSGVSTYFWDGIAGAAGATGATLRVSLKGDGTVNGSITFAGLDVSQETNIQLLGGSTGGVDYLYLYM